MPIKFVHHRSSKAFAPTETHLHMSQICSGRSKIPIFNFKVTMEAQASDSLIHIHLISLVIGHLQGRCNADSLELESFMLFKNGSLLPQTFTSRLFQDLQVFRRDS